MSTSYASKYWMNVLFQFYNEKSIEENTWKWTIYQCEAIAIANWNNDPTNISFKSERLEVYLFLNDVAAKLILIKFGIEIAIHVIIFYVPVPWAEPRMDTNIE